MSLSDLLERDGSCDLYFEEMKTNICLYPVFSVIIMRVVNFFFVPLKIL